MPLSVSHFARCYFARHPPARFVFIAIDTIPALKIPHTSGNGLEMHLGKPDLRPFQATHRPFDFGT